MKSRKNVRSRRAKKYSKVESPKKSRRPSRVKSPKKNIRSPRVKRYDGMKKACIQWEKIPPEKMEDYEVRTKTCRKCGRFSSAPYLVHAEGGDYDCYKCGKDVNIRHICPYCIRKK